jgi:hypothetical protein
MPLDKKIGECVRCGNRLPPYVRGRRRKFCPECVAGGASEESLVSAVVRASVSIASRRSRWAAVGRRASGVRLAGRGGGGLVGILSGGSGFGEAAEGEREAWRQDLLAALKEQHRRRSWTTPRGDLPHPNS